MKGAQDGRSWVNSPLNYFGNTLLYTCRMEQPCLFADSPDVKIDSCGLIV